MPATPHACRACAAPPPLGDYGLCPTCLTDYGAPLFKGPRALIVMVVSFLLGAAVLVYLEVEGLWVFVGAALASAGLVFFGGILVELVRMNRLIARRGRS